MDTLLLSTFRKKNQAITLGTKFAMKIDGASIHIERLIIVAKAMEKHLDQFSSSNMQLSTLFDSSMLLREPQNPVLADAIWVVPNLLLQRLKVMYSACWMVAH